MHISSTVPSYSNVQLIRDLLRFLQPYTVPYASATVLRTVGDVFRLYPAYATAETVTFLSGYQSTESLTPLWWYIFSGAAAYIVHIICRQAAKLIGYKVAEHAALDAELHTLEHLFLLDLSWHEQENSGNKLKRLLKGKEGVNNILRMWLTYYIEIGVNFVGITFILASVDTAIALVFLLYIVLYYSVSHFFTKRASAKAHEVHIAEEHLHGLAFEAINSIRSVKVLGMGAAIIHRFQEHMKNLLSSIQKRIFWFQSRYIAVDTFSILFRFGMMTYIALGIVQGRYEVGILVLFMTYFLKITENIEEFSMVTLDFLVDKYSVSRMMDMLIEPIGIDSTHEKIDFPKEWDALRINNLSFSYSSGSPVLHNISFSIRRGEKVGIVGKSGAGKSTLLKLLLKEHEQYEGDILVGSTPLRNIRRTDFFQHAAVVLQETEVFNFQLKENIWLANPKEAHNEALLHTALQTAHVQDFLQKLPDGLETYIGEKGVKLSGGEKQRVGIARALFKQPEILFLDEATSHLDTESEENIQDSLHQFFQNVTAVVIAHRLSTIKEMDRILVLESGKIIEEGSFDELLVKKGRFFDLWKKQGF